MGRPKLALRPEASVLDQALSKFAISYGSVSDSLNQIPGVVVTVPDQGVGTLEPADCARQAASVRLEAMQNNLELKKWVEDTRAYEVGAPP